MEVRKCSKYACPGYSVKVDVLLTGSYMYKALTVHPTMSNEGNGGRIHRFSSVSDSCSLCYSSRHNSNVDQKWVIKIKFKKIQCSHHCSCNRFLLMLIANSKEKTVMYDYCLILNYTRAHLSLICF